MQRVKWSLARKTIYLAFCLQAAAGLAPAQESLTALRELVREQEARLAEQAEKLRAQQEMLQQQQGVLQTLAARLSELEAAPSAVAAAPATPPSGTATIVRDSVGDLNAQAVTAGKFPGSIAIPGTESLSLRIGGFVKAVAIVDSDAEALGASPLAAVVGTSRPDQDGNFALDATITRLNIDARAPAGDGGLRGYIEWDFNAANNGNMSYNLRHAYGTWSNGAGGQLVAGHTWSTFMDLQVIPEGLTEPTVSGAIFRRQAQLRWSQPVSERLGLDFGIERPGSTDFAAEQPGLGRSRAPDFVATSTYKWPGLAHVKLGGIVRKLEIRNDQGLSSTTGWGLAATGHLDILGRDKLALSAVYGKGIGRYFLGLDSFAGGYVAPANDDLLLRKNYGGFVSYRHGWSRTTRSTFSIGRAQASPLYAQSSDTFRASSFGSANLMWSVLPYMTVGMEYDYGVRELNDRNEKSNHRVMFGVQIY